MYFNWHDKHLSKGLAILLMVIARMEIILPVSTLTFFVMRVTPYNM